MGTRSLTYVYDDNGDSALVCMYRQYDGYPSGHGKELADFLMPLTLVNGLGFNEERAVANGMGCLAAQMVAKFKDGPGDIYLMAPKEDIDSWQEYEYRIYPSKVVVNTTSGVIFEGSWEKFFNFCEEAE